MIQSPTVKQGECCASVLKALYRLLQVRSANGKYLMVMFCYFFLPDSSSVLPTSEESKYYSFLVFFPFSC